MSTHDQDAARGGAEHEFPLEEVDRLVGEAKKLRDAANDLCLFRERLLLDFRHAFERIQLDLRCSAYEAFGKIPAAISAGDADAAAALTTKGLTAIRLSETALNDAIRSDYLLSKVCDE